MSAEHSRRSWLRAAGSGLIATLLLLSTAPAVQGEWLVTRDGAAIEVDGPWKVEGKMVIFTLPDGKFSSLRLTEVDLDASEALTAEKAAADKAPAPSAAAPRQATFVLTDADVRRGVPATAEAEEAEAEEPPADDDGKPAVAPLNITNWEEHLVPGATAVEIIGTVRNPGPNPATSINIQVMLYNEEGVLLGQTRAQLDRRVLRPGSSTGFTASFPDVHNYSAVKFDVGSRGFRTHTYEGSESEDSQPPGS